MENLKSRESGGLADSMNNTGDLVVQASQINLPKGGGWIKSIDEKIPCERRQWYGVIHHSPTLCAGP